MKICFITDHFYPYVGGMETFYLEAAKGLHRLGHEVRVVTSTYKEYIGNRQIDGLDVYYYPWNMLFGHPIVRCKDLVEHIQWADVVHTGAHTAAVSSQKVARKCGVPVVATLPEIAGDKWKFIEPNPIKAIIFRMFEYYVAKQDYDLIHVISEATKRDYKRFIKNNAKVEMAYLFLDENYQELANKSHLNLKKYFELDDDKKVILYFGRPGQSKGLFVYLDALKKFAKRYGLEAANNYRFCFILASEPKNTRNKFLKEISCAHLDSIVRISNSLSKEDLFQAISQSEVVVVPSIAEGFGFSAGEACMLGCKIIYSSGGSLPEVVFGQALAFENRNSNDLCEKLHYVCEGKDVFQTIPPKTFLLSDMINNLEKIYKKLVYIQ